VFLKIFGLKLNKFFIALLCILTCSLNSSLEYKKESE